MRRIIGLGVALLLLGMMPSSGLAGNFDESKPLICAIQETFECEPGLDCKRGTAGSIDLPDFFRVYLKEKKILLSRGDTEESTNIENMGRIGEIWFLQGIERRGWTLSISEKTGKGVLAAAGEEEGFVVFGACTPQ